MKKITIFVMLCVVIGMLSGCIKVEIPANVPEKDDPPTKAEATVPDTPAPAPADTENNPTPQTPDIARPAPSSAPPQSEPPAVSSGKWFGRLTAYEEILNEIYQSYEDPERFLYERGPSFALYDVDCDGVEELVVQDPGDENANQWIRVYGYDDETQTAYVELEEYSDHCCYSNGIFEILWSHNQCPSGDRLWAYTLYQYTNRPVYERIASVEGWDKSVTDIYHGVPFPDDADKDGDGFVYYIITEEGGYMPEYGEPMDNAEYEEWRQSYLQGAEPSGFSFVPLVKENISLQ